MRKLTLPVRYLPLGALLCALLLLFGSRDRRHTTLHGAQFAPVAALNRPR